MRSSTRYARPMSLYSDTSRSRSSCRPTCLPLRPSNPRNCPRPNRTVRPYATSSDIPPSLAPRRLPPRPPSTPPPSSRNSAQPPISGPSSSLTYHPPQFPRSSLPRPRLDIPSFISSPAHTTSNHLARRSSLPLGEEHIHHLSRVREQQLDILRKLERARRRQNEISAEIKGLVGKYQILRREDGEARMKEEREELVRQAKKLKERSTDLERHLEETETHLAELSLVLPNWTHPDVPIGPEDQAVELERFGPEPIPAAAERDHLAVCQYWDLVDVEASATTTGSSWMYLKGTLALLEQALINYALSIAIRHGFTPVAVPDVVKSDIAWRCGFAPRDSGGAAQTYFINADNTAEGLRKFQEHEHDAELCLAGTAEIPLAGLFANRILPPASLPAMVIGVGRAFRAEAGARGQDTRGLYRVHQFSKVELFAVTAASSPQSTQPPSAQSSQGEGEPALPEVNSRESEAMMLRIAAVQKEIAEGLGLSVRVLDMPTEELGASAYRKWDMEAWMPGRGKWGEITSTSNCTDYQARRLHIRYSDPTPPSPKTALTSEAEGPKTGSQKHNPVPFCHTLNGTAAAIPRLLVAMIENGVRFDNEGHPTALDLPKALQRFWLGADEVGYGKKKGTIHWV